MIEDIEEVEVYELDGAGLVPVKKTKPKYDEALFLVYFGSTGTAKGKFLPEAVELMNLKPDAKTKVHKSINLTSLNKGKYICVYDSTDLDVQSKIELTKTYLINLSAKQYKTIFETNKMPTDKIDCYFKLTSKMAGKQEVFKLEKSDIKVEKTELTPEQIADKLSLSNSATEEHAIFKKYATKNKIDTTGKGIYMKKFQKWETEKKQDADFRVYAKLNGIAINNKELFDSHFKVWSKEQAKSKMVKKTK